MTFIHLTIQIAVKVPYWAWIALAVVEELFGLALRLLLEDNLWGVGVGGVGRDYLCF